MDITALIWPAVNRGEIARVLDDVGDDVRLKSLYELGRRDMARLFDAAQENEPLSLDHFVPSDTPPETTAVHHGKNSLNWFRHFEKRFCRPSGGGPSDGAQPELWGYNEQPLRWLTGPGIFVAYPQGPKEIVFDYGRVPAVPLPPDWPRPMRNDAGLSRFVYGRGMTDIVRRVSNLVAIGRVHREGRPQDVWFVLVRGKGVSTSTRPFPLP